MFNCLVARAGTTFSFFKAFLLLLSVIGGKAIYMPYLSAENEAITLEITIPYLWAID